LITGIPRHNRGSATTVPPRDAAPPPRTGPRPQLSAQLCCACRSAQPCCAGHGGLA